LTCQGEAEFQQLVETATVPIDIEGRKGWRVTVTTAAGARGQDYQISDDTVDQNGGLLLVLEYIPDSEREWIQFLGRTARHDHPGQYSVIVNREEYQDALHSNTPKEDGPIEKQILDHINEKTARKVAEADMQLQRGMLMHEYTTAFWSWFKRVQIPDEERNDRFFKWVDLDNFAEMSLEKITESFYAIGITTQMDTLARDLSTDAPPILVDLDSPDEESLGFVARITDAPWIFVDL